MSGVCTTLTVLGEPAEPQLDWLQLAVVAMLMFMLMAALEEEGE